MFRPLKLFKKILVILTAGVMLFSCGHSLNGGTVIDEIEILSVSKNITLKVGETSPKYYLKVTAKDEVDVGDVVCLNVDGSIAAVSFERTQIGNVFCYQIEGLSVGTCVISFTNASGEVSSAILSVTVLPSEESVEGSASNADNVSETEAEREEQTTQDEVLPEESERDVSTDVENPVESQTVSENQGEETTVYVTPSGTRYHFSISCAGKNATATTLEEAIKTKTPCKKCAGG